MQYFFFSTSACHLCFSVKWEILFPLVNSSLDDLFFFHTTIQDISEIVILVHKSTSEEI